MSSHEFPHSLLQKMLKAIKILAFQRSLISKSAFTEVLQYFRAEVQKYYSRTCRVNAWMAVPALLNMFGWSTSHTEQGGRE